MSSESSNSEVEGLSRDDWRDELKRRIEAHQQRKEDPDSDSAPQEDAEGAGRSPSQQAADAPAAPSFEWDSLQVASSPSESKGLDDEAATQPPKEMPSDATELLREGTGASPQESQTGPSGFENGQTFTAGDSSLIERSLDPTQASPASRQQIVTFTEKATPSRPPLEKGLQAPVWSASESAIPSDSFIQEEQALLEDDFPDDDLNPDEEIERVSREIFLSRLLAGLVDVLLAAFFGLTFGWAASGLLGFDFFSPATVEIGAATGLFFYLAGSLFFLLLSGQTPGMHLTGLQLLYQESTDLPFMAALIRVIAILPVTVTVAGLLWGFFDPWGRCLHDRISQTRVTFVPEGPRPNRPQLFE